MGAEPTTKKPIDRIEGMFYEVDLEKGCDVELLQSVITLGKGVFRGGLEGGVYCMICKGVRTRCREGFRE